MIIKNIVVLTCAVTALAWPSGLLFGQNLVLNPGCEDTLVSGNIPHWVEHQGTSWTQRGTNPPALTGSYYFFPGAISAAELRQDVEVSAYADSIDAGLKVMLFRGFMRAYDQNPPDTAQIIVECLDEARTSLLSAFQSPRIGTYTAWVPFTQVFLPPAGTRWIRIRLIARRYNGSNNDAYFDEISLLPHYPAHLAARFDPPHIRLSWPAITGDTVTTYRIYTDSLQTGSFLDLLGETGDSTFVDSNAASRSTPLRFYLMRYLR